MTCGVLKLTNKKVFSISDRWFKILLSSLLFLGVLPFDKAALTMYSSERIGSILSYGLCGTTLLVSLCLFVFKRKVTISHANRRFFTVGFFVFLGFVLSSIGNGINLLRLMSVICFLTYYFFCYFFFDDIDDLLLSIGISLAALIAFSFILYFQHNSHVMYVASAYETDFKGIALNRNSFAELALFDVVVFSYFLVKKKYVVFSLFSAGLAIYGIFLTKGAASIICCVLLIVGLLFNKALKKAISFRSFIVFLIVSLLFVFLFKRIDSLEPMYILFNKSSSLTGRTDIWDYTIPLISNKPLFGYGYDFTVLLDNGFIENDPHNGILYILLSQGLFGLAIFLYALYSLMRDAAYFKGDILVRFLFIFVAVWSVRALVESGYSYTHFIFWICPLIVFKKCCGQRCCREQK